MSDRATQIRLESPTSEDSDFDSESRGMLIFGVNSKGKTKVMRLTGMSNESLKVLEQNTHLLREITNKLGKIIELLTEAN